MALISPSNLLTLHHTGGNQTKALQQISSARYKLGDWETTIPNPSVFTGLAKEDPGAGALPTTSECAVHLEMLEAFYTLQQEVIHSTELDVAFGVQAKPRTVYRKKWDGRKYAAEPATLKDTGFAQRRKDKWSHFLRIAVERFHDWIRIVENQLNQEETSSTSPKYLLLPPLDVLLVWHAFLLNCDDFKEYCDQRQLRHVQSIVFPWADIHNAIDSGTWMYTLPAEHSEWLRQIAKIDDNLVHSLIKAGLESGATSSLLVTFGDTAVDTESDDDSVPLVRAIRAAHASSAENKRLVQNVERQCVFVEKMHAHRWIRSPAVEGTLRRAVDRYDKFLHLFRRYRNTFLVPTLDVDLAWHTHQCSASNYRQFVTERVGRFINHDDKIGRGTLDGGFTSAEELYRLTYGEQYQVCLCWSCEAILSAVEELGEDVFEDKQPSVSGLAQRVEREVHYYREVEIARRLGRSMPIWKH